jgi:glycosyltransferase involved in cell wall biosynthesis
MGDDMLRILIDARPLATDHRQRGIGAYVSGLISQIEKMRSVAELDGIHVAYLWPPNESPLLARVSLPGSDAPLEPRLVPSLEEGDWHVYHATTVEGVTLSPRFRTVATLYDLIPLRQVDWAKRARHPSAHLAYLRQLRLLTRASHIISVSHATKRDACDLLHISTDRVSVIPPVQDTARVYIPTSEQRAGVRRTLGLEEPYFLAVASSDRHKNLARVLQAFAAFRDTSDGSSSASGGYQLYLVGAWMGREGRRIRGLIDELGLGGVARHLPWIPAQYMSSLYASATALVFPSLIEGFGLPILEAMTCGAPVITSNRSSLPEVAGDAALYVTPENVSEIAAAMQQLASSPMLRASLVAKGFARSREFGEERAARDMIAVYRRVANADSVAARQS